MTGDSAADWAAEGVPNSTLLQKPFATAQMITCELDDGAVFTVRGSGTEPKIKLYIECRGSSSEEAKTGAKGILDDLLREWFKPEVNGLKLA